LVCDTWVVVMEAFLNSPLPFLYRIHPNQTEFPREHNVVEGMHENFNLRVQFLACNVREFFDLQNTRVL
jgi:hypothetical protein